MSENKVLRVIKGSIAEEVGIEKGDKLISINGNKVKDIIDYQYLMADEILYIEILKQNSDIWEIEIEKDYDEDIGIVFEDPTIDKPRSCNNKCIFCFIDQLPKGMRKTLYFKDDDSRLSFLQGNFITLTNMKDEDIDRIIKYKISPINISVHTTNPELRVKMLNNRFAGNIMSVMKKIADAGIYMNCQIVCCPGINDKEELKNTINDLYTLYPYVKSVAVVPIGLTKYREGLYNLRTFEKEEAKYEIEDVAKLQEKFLKENNTPFVRLSDEFYLLAGVDVPSDKFYGDYDQFEDGIGMIRLFRENIKRNINKLGKKLSGNLMIVTGALAYDEIKNTSQLIMKHNKNLNITVKKIINNFFGEKITVSGLLTGTDIINQLKNEKLPKHLILPGNVIRKGYELSNNDDKILLDDITIEDIEKELKVKIFLAKDTGEDFIDIINCCIKEENNE